MNFKALIATLVLGCSTIGIVSTASAAPARDASHRVDTGRDNGRREQPAHVQPARVQPRRVEPARVEPARIERGRVDRDRGEYREVERRPIVVRPIYQQTTYVSTWAPAFTDGQMFVGLGGASGGGIELTSNGGSTFIQQVAVKYADGRTQLIEVGQSVDGNHPSIDLATDGSAIYGVVIYGQGSGVSAIAI
jgi:hypothetical protein